MIRLRGHHLLCSLTYAGRGYSKDFERGFNQVIERLKMNETILIVAGPDDVCKPIMDCDQSHCREARILRRDELALEDLASHLNEPISIGSKIKPDQFFGAKFRSAFRQRTIRRACFDCQWAEICDQIADADYASTLLLR